jgi:hypothetical protein
MNRDSLAFTQIRCGLAIWMIASKIIGKLFFFPIFTSKTGISSKKARFFSIAEGH